MKTILSILTTLLVCGIAAAQTTNQMVAASDSDPQAKAALDKMRNKYEQYNSIEATGELEIGFPEQPAEVQQLKIIRSGDQYKVDIGSQTILSDGKSIYVILHNNKDVQINDIPEDDEMGMLTPQSLFNFYDSDQFVFVMAGEIQEDGRTAQQIEFKPTDRYSDYSKLRMTINKSDASLKRVKAFGKDGSTFTFTLTAIKPNVKPDASMFTFNQSAYPDYYVEDLRN